MSYNLISTVTVGAGGAASLDFNSIPQTYTDLVLVFSLRDNRSGQNNSPVGLKINGVTTNRTYRELEYGTGTPASFNGTTEWIGFGGGATATANTFGNGQVYLANYAGAANKALSADSVSEDNTSVIEMALWASLWSSTAAITSLSLTCPLATLFSQYSTASLYGIV